MNSPAAPVVERVPTANVAMPVRSGSGRAVAFALAGAVVVLLAGMALGRRGDASPSSLGAARPAPAATPERAESDPHFSSATAATAVDTAVARAKACRAPGTPSGPLVVRLTFAQTGQVVGVDISGPLTGTPAGDCFAAALRDVRVPSFDGGLASFARTVEAR